VADSFAPAWTGVAVPQSSAECATRCKILIRRGVPDNLRRCVWLAASGALEPRAAFAGGYNAALRQTFGARGAPDSMGAFPTFGGVFDPANHLLTPTGTEAARRVLAVLGTVHPDVSFCPRLCDLVQILLAFMYEEDAFAIAHALILRSRSTRWYLEMTHRDHAAFYRAFASILDLRQPRLARKLEEFGIDAENYATRWFDGLFAGAITYPLVLRVMDAYLNEGTKMLLRVGLAILDQLKNALRATQAPD
jgi:hypothetical protein